MSDNKPINTVPRSADPLGTWALVADGRVIDVVQAAAEPEAAEAGRWLDATGAKPAPIVGMAYTEGSGYTMPRWAQIAGNTVANVVEQISRPGEDWQDCTGMHVGPGHGWSDGKFTQPVQTERPWITKLAFRNRFNAEEQIGIEIAALDDPAAPMQSRATSAALRAANANLNAALFVDLSYSDTRAGVQALEAAGVLAKGRAAEVLDAPVRDWERYAGGGV